MAAKEVGHGRPTGRGLQHETGVIEAHLHNPVLSKAKVVHVDDLTEAAREGGGVNVHGQA